MRLILLITLLLFCVNVAVAQTDEPVYHAIDKAHWEKTVKGLNYNEQPEKPIKPPKPNEPLTMPESDYTFLQVMGFLLIIGLLIFILVYLFGKGILFNKKVPSILINPLTELDDRPMESDLERFLREALASRDYKLAIRIYYLMILKSLHESELIVWKKEKTNMDYMRELQEHPQYESLNNNTYVFEYVWYGEKPIYESQFNILSKPFIQLLQLMKSPK